MTLPEGPLEYAREAAKRIRELENQTEQARAEFRQAVRALRYTGGSPPEIAEALGITKNEVDRIVGRTDQTRWWRIRRSASPHPVVCSFCGREQKQVRKLIGGPGVFICDMCASRGTEIAGGAPSSSGLRLADANEGRCCSFCGKVLPDVSALVVGPTEVICTDCLNLCKDIVHEEQTP